MKKPEQWVVRIHRCERPVAEYDMNNQGDVAKLLAILRERQRALNPKPASLNKLDIPLRYEDVVNFVRSRGWEMSLASQMWKIFDIHNIPYRYPEPWQPEMHTEFDRRDQVIRLGLIAGYDDEEDLAQAMKVNGRGVARAWKDILAKHGLMLGLDTRAWLAERARRGRLYDMHLPPPPPQKQG
jgi:hypothetical protein